MRYRRRAKRDANHAPIVRALERAGRCVVDLSHAGGGVPDLLVSWSGRCLLLEIKNPEADHPKDEQTQIEFRRRWKGPPVVTVWSEAEALAATGVKVA